MITQRARFSVAHELGHAVLHSGFIKQQKIHTIQEYLVSTKSLSDDEYRDFEWQANEFAGRFFT
jgi:Zn-dependent peptidase ImmA (M78 family)